VLMCYFKLWFPDKIPDYSVRCGCNNSWFLLYKDILGGGAGVSACSFLWSATVFLGPV